MKTAVSDYLFPIILSASAALVAAAVGFVLGVVLTARLPGEAGEWGLIAAPVCALLMSVPTFFLCFRKLRP
jgi:hypothetical protein